MNGQPDLGDGLRARVEQLEQRTAEALSHINRALERGQWGLTGDDLINARTALRGHP
jgi:hypothetical protein